MNFLPIVTRELRVASRRKGTYWIRWCAAGLAIFVAAILMALAQLTNPTASGVQIFMTLAYYTFGLCVLAGVFLTADCLSEEKREGTIGLFFLTDLKGYDVVLGKLMATSLNAFYGLLALLPILGLPLLVGGVTGAEFWRTALALVNALFFSLALGIWISARSKNAQKAMVATLIGLGFFVIALPLINQGLSAFGAGLWANVATANPLSTMLVASEVEYKSDPTRYFVTLGVTHLIAWAFVLMASISLPRSWQETAALRSAIVKKTADMLGRRVAESERPGLLQQNPIVWMMSGSVGLARTIWGLSITAASILFLTSVYGGDASFMLASSFAWPVTFLLKLLIAIRATMFFAETRRSGALELILSTPLTNAEILDGQALALKRLFFWPVIVVAIAMLFPPLGQMATQGFGVGIFVGVMSFYGALQFVANIYAICWFGMWMALTCKKPSLASAWTILFAVILPMFVLCVPSIAFDIFLIFWSKQRLQTDFRNLASAMKI
jgi:ABC-type transport system involved in multi-copper enzyme maturation permease subunit